MRSSRKVFALLLNFTMLAEKPRREFLTKMNEFLMMSPIQKKRTINEWRDIVDVELCDLTDDEARRQPDASELCLKAKRRVVTKEKP